MTFDDKLPRIVVVTVRSDELGGWVLEVDAPDLDPWQKLAYLREALLIAENEVDRLDDDADND
jgi:hypothetical protein